MNYFLLILLKDDISSTAYYYYLEIYKYFFYYQHLCYYLLHTYNILSKQKNFLYFKYVKMNTLLKKDCRESINLRLQQMNHKYHAGNNRPSEVLHRLQQYSRMLRGLTVYTSAESLPSGNLAAPAPCEGSH